MQLEGSLVRTRSRASLCSQPRIATLGLASFLTFRSHEWTHSTRAHFNARQRLHIDTPNRPLSAQHRTCSKTSYARILYHDSLPRHWRRLLPCSSWYAVCRRCGCVTWSRECTVYRSSRSHIVVYCSKQRVGANLYTDHLCSCRFFNETYLETKQKNPICHF